MNSPTYAAGASASINKTLREIESIVGGAKLPKVGPKREELRKKLQAALVEASTNWYRRGIKRGHRAAYAKFSETAAVPIQISVDVTREFLPNTKVPVKIISKLSAKFLASFEA